jgi:hypothetical protein
VLHAAAIVHVILLPDARRSPLLCHGASRAALPADRLTQESSDATGR